MLDILEKLVFAKNISCSSGLTLVVYSLSSSAYFLLLPSSHLGTIMLPGLSCLEILLHM